MPARPRCSPPTGLLPRQRNGPILAERMTVPADVLQVRQPGQDRNQKLDHFGLWPMRPHLLLQGHGVEGGGETQLAGILTQQHQPRMLGSVV